MSFYSIVDSAATWTSIPFAIIGFGVTIRQTTKAKTAAEHASKAAQDVRENISRASLLVLIPQLHRAEEQLERAVRDQSVDLVLSWLSTWRWQAGQARGLLDEGDQLQRTVIILLQESITSASSAKSKLIDGSTPNVVSATRGARTAVGKVTSELGAMAAIYGLQAGGN
ncbi:hypothetical protein O3Q52_08835 [Streptomyces sp. ActVer]|uniref:hypothetical protein n=1 Tax=Streptomyces sp. ActVer TaxID=3014558 RepID=UPI0022B30A86|nr:hypothetical protein [Streptomyces sp. ActVer]MCZ4508306.1 hypothetical protein [Streptomyces sp. ActVer]